MLNLTTAECLHHAHDDTPTDQSHVSDLEAYGYGFLMVVLVSLASLIGVVIVPMTRSKSTLGKQIYEFTYAFMVALAISALVSDAILHLMPHVFNLHGHEETTTGHNHGSAEEEEENPDYIWKSCVVLLGIYGFYLFELFIHTVVHHLTKLPDLIHDTDAKLTSHGWQWWLRFFLVNFGFLTSFAVLLVLAVYEDKINELVS